MNSVFVWTLSDVVELTIFVLLGLPLLLLILADSIERRIKNRNKKK